MKRLKNYSIKTKIIIEEVRAKYKKGNFYRQPTIYYNYRIESPGLKICRGGFKNEKELFKSLQEIILPKQNKSKGGKK